MFLEEGMRIGRVRPAVGETGDDIGAIAEVLGATGPLSLTTLRRFMREALDAAVVSSWMSRSSTIVLDAC